MDDAGIDRQVAFGLDFGVCLDEPDVPIEDVNRRLATLQSEHPDRLVAFATVDPRRTHARELVETAVSDWGMQGLKLHPTAGFHLHDDATYEVLEVAADNDLPVLTDSGPINAPLYSKYSAPIHVDEVLVDFPNIDLIVAHLSLGWWRDLHAIAEMKTATKLHVDVSGWQERIDHNAEEFLRAVRLFIDSLGADRVHFGTDDPMFDPVHPKEEWLATLRSLAHRPDEPTFTTDEIDLLLGDGAAELLD
jgi:predicted TIM-barrel fold metal-dependent hydrolase